MNVFYLKGSIPSACATNFILGKYNSPPFPHCTHVSVGISFTGEVSSDRLMSCPGGGESHLSAKRHKIGDWLYPYVLYGSKRQTKFN